MLIDLDWLRNRAKIARQTASVHLASCKWKITKLLPQTLKLKIHQRVFWQQLHFFICRFQKYTFNHHLPLQLILHIFIITILFIIIIIIITHIIIFIISLYHHHCIIIITSSSSHHHHLIIIPIISSSTYQCHYIFISLHHHHHHQHH